MCYMKIVTHREMRNQSGDILRRVAAGESVQISNNGRLTAMIVPVGGSALDGLIARGEARPARAGVEVLLSIQRVAAPMTAANLIADSRGPW
jgi:prevent-host-death family protein